MTKENHTKKMNYQFDETTLCHTIFAGSARAGKTVVAMHFAKELVHVRRKETGKGIRIIVMDTKQNWRKLAHDVEPERFRIYSLGDIDYPPLHINPWKVPVGVHPKQWADIVIEMYCLSYGLLDRGGKPILRDAVYELYDEAGVFKLCDKEDWEISDEIKKASANVNFKTIYERLCQRKAEMETFNENNIQDAYSRLLERLSCFSRKSSIESKFFGNSDGIGVDEFIEGNDELQNEDLKGMGMITVLESEGLGMVFSNFIFGIITSGLYHFAKGHESGFLSPNQNETVLVIEDANNVLLGSDFGPKDIPFLDNENEFDRIMNHAADYGLYIFSITQKIDDMPSSVIENSGLVFSGRMARPCDINTVAHICGWEGKMNEKDLDQLFLHLPIGTFVCKSVDDENGKDTEPVIIQIDNRTRKCEGNESFR